MEINESVAQKRRRIVLEFISTNGALFDRQGSVQESWRYYQGRRLGPFFRLVFRRNGWQQSRYLGADPILAADVRRALRDLQRPRRERRLLDHLRAYARPALAEAKRVLDTELRRYGACRKGFEIRGVRRLRAALSVVSS